jgi:hypothetical protein
MEQALQHLKERLEGEFLGFQRTQRIHFDWLQGIAAQLGHCESNLPPSRPSPVVNQIRQTGPPLRGLPSVPVGTIRFVDTSALLDDSDSDSNDGFVAPMSGQSLKLPQSPSRFQDDTKGRTAPPMSPIVLQFGDNDGKDSWPNGYNISDDEEYDDDDDDEIYERNPIEIHGKTIPRWARGEKLLHQLKKQRRIDPNTIFEGFTTECSLPDIFKAQKPRWEIRGDSAYWPDEGALPS